MKSIRVENFAGLAECSTDTFSSVESFPPVNYEFLSGKTYGIISDFGCGGWGLANAITGNGRWETQSKVYIDKRLSTKEELKLLSGNILDPIWYNFFDDKSKCTVHNCIEYALFAGHQKYTHSEIKDIFCLSNARYNRTMDFVSGEIWSISLAILFALGKHIIAYPWLNAIDARKILFLQKQGIIDFLEKQGTLLLLPSSQKSIISKCCNNYICFKISPRRATVQYR